MNRFANEFGYQSRFNRASLLEMRDALIEARLAGARRVKDQNGEEIEYKTDAEMAKALQYVESLIYPAKPSTIKFNSSKGV